METERQPGECIRGGNREALIPRDSDLGHRSRGLRELSQLHVPTHAFKHNPSTPDLTTPLLPKTPSLGNSYRTVAGDTAHLKGLAVDASNLDRGSLRSAAPTTISTSSENPSTSNGASSMVLTVSSAPTSLSSGHSEISATDILELEKGVFAAPKVPLELKDQSAWNSIRPRLQNTIDNTLRTRPGLESTISCEFMMGGPNPKQMRPTVFLVCCHETYRKQLKAILKRQKWTKESGYQWVIIVDAFEELAFGSLDITPGTDSVLVQSSFSHEKISLCGLLAKAQRRTHDEPVKFTIGGILLIDGKAFGLTAGHIIEKLNLAESFTDDDSEDEDDSGSSPFVVFDDEDHVETTSLASSKSCTPVWENEVNDSVTGAAKNAGTSQDNGMGWTCFGHIPSPSLSRSTLIHEQLDWSLVSLDPELEAFHRPLINTFQLPTGNCISIDRLLSKSTIIGCEVWINAGSTGMVRGWLLDSLVLFHQRGKTFQVLQVVADIPLAPGDSGSWVLMDNVLCGHVLASRNSLPWLYVLPIFDILPEITRTMPCQEVILPQPQRHPAGSILMHGRSETSASGSDTIFPDRAESESSASVQEQQWNSNYLPQMGSETLLLPQKPDLVTNTRVLRACLGRMYLEKASSAQLSYSAYEDHCRKVMKYVFNSLGSGVLDEEGLLDVLQMIHCGLHKSEIVATLQQRITCGPDRIRSLVEFVDWAASLLVMVKITDTALLEHHTWWNRMPWTQENLKDTVSNYFSGQTDLSDTGIRLDTTFTTKSLVKIAGLRIIWTANLGDHLRLDSEQRVLCIFHHVTFLECQRKNPESLLPKGLVEETLTTLALLFPSEANKAPFSWLREKSVLYGQTHEYDYSLHSVGMKPLDPYQREIGSFYHWHDRLVVLKRLLDESPANHTLSRFWHDQRDARQWYMFWGSALTIFLLVLLNTVNIVLSSVQVARSSRLGMTGPAGQQPSTATSVWVESSTVTSLSVESTTVPPTEAVKEHHNQLRSGAIVGITFAVIIVLGPILWYWCRLVLNRARLHRINGKYLP